MSSFPESYGLPCYKTWETFLLSYRGGLGGQIPRYLCYSLLTWGKVTLDLGRGRWKISQNLILFPPNLGQVNVGLGEG